MKFTDLKFTLQLGADRALCVGGSGLEAGFVYNGASYNLNLGGLAEVLCRDTPYK